MLTPIRATDSIELPFPEAAVWAILARFEEYPNWWPSTLRLRVIANPDGGAGPEFEVQPPASRPFRCRVEEVRPPEWIRMRYHGDLIQGSGVLKLEPSGSGSRVTYDLDALARGWLVAVLARFLDVASIHSRQMRGVLENLRLVLQAGQGKPA